MELSARAVRGRAAGWVVLVGLIALLVGSTVIQRAQAASWEKAITAPKGPFAARPVGAAAPEPPDAITDDPSLTRWTVDVDVEQERSVRAGEENVWRLTVRVVLPPDAPALAALRSELTGDAAAISAALAGRVEVTGDYLSPRSYVITQPAPDRPAEVTFSARRREPAYRTAYVIVREPNGVLAGTRTVRLRSASYDVTSVSPTYPAAQAARTVEYRFGHEDQPLPISVDFGSAGAGTYPPPWREAARATWLALLSMAGWLLAYAITRRPEFAGVAYARPLRRSVLLLVALHAVARLLAVLARIGDWLQWSPESPFRSIFAGVAVSGPSIVLVALLGVAAPAAAAAGRGRTAARFWLAVATAAVAFDALVLAELARVAPERRTALLATGAAALAGTVVAALAAHVVRVPAPPAAAVVAVTALLSTLAPLSIDGGSPLARAVRMAVVVPVTVVAVGAVGAIAWSATGRAWPRPRWRVAVPVVLAAAAVAYPYGYPAAGWPSLASVAYVLASLGTVAVAVALVAAIRSALAEDDAGRATRLRWLALAFGVVTFLRPGQIVGYVPLALIAGSAVLFWALPAPRPDTSLAEVEPAEHALNVAATLKARVAERAATRMRRKLREKVESGELGYGEAEAKVGAMEQVAAQARAARPAESLEVAAFGSFVAPPWRQARAGALAGFVLGLPWALLHVDEVVGWHAGFTFPALTVLADAPFQFGRWTAYGFLFGACYPLLRGRTGLGKGLALFAVTLAPLVATLLALGARTDRHQAGLVLATCQLFLHFMLLGLAADVYALRLAGPGTYNPRRIVDLHDLRAVVAWSTSVTVALGAALSTAVVSGATAAVMNMFQPPERVAPPITTTTQQR